MVDPEKLITQAGMARKFNVSRGRIQYMIKQKELDTVEIRGGITLIIEHNKLT